MRLRGWSFPFVAILLMASIGIAIVTGPAAISLSETLRALTGADHDPARTILLSLRMPRAGAAVLTGGGLAVSGALFQALLRNPLAEPWLLGVSAGAALGAVGAMALGVAGSGAAALPLAALAGALVAIAIVFRVAWSVDRLDTGVLLLAGVVTSAFFGACVMLVLTFAGHTLVRSALFWTLGGLSGVSWHEVGILAAYVVPAGVGAFGMSRHLNALSLGEDTAATLGTDVEKIKLLSFLIASLLAAATVAVAGVIGFVGLVVPHTVRLLSGGDHRTLIPLSFLLGGALLVITDTLARSIASPLEIPVGVVTAFVGVPLFMVLLRRRYVR